MKPLICYKVYSLIIFLQNTVWKKLQQIGEPLREIHAKQVPDLEKKPSWCQESGWLEKREEKEQKQEQRLGSNYKNQSSDAEV